MRKFKKWLEHLLKHNTFIQTLYRVVMSAVFKFIGLFIRTDENLVLMNGHGFRYNDSPRAIYEKMAELGMLSKYRVVWALREAEKYEIEGAEKIEIDTPKYFITALRAKYWISCVNIERALHFKKKNTVYLNTWHGASLNHVGNAVSKRNDFHYEHVDFFCINGEYERDFVIRDFNLLPESLLTSGYPRNDALYEADEEKTREFREALGIPEGKRVMLYAPTWRDSTDGGASHKLAPPIDWQRWKSELGDEWVVLLRTHPYTTKLMNVQFDDFVINCTDYPRINDLMIASDLLISDYSSTILDYSILEKPIICFGYDFEEYSAQRGFYFDMETVMPGGVVRNEDALLSRIKTIDWESERAEAKKLKDEHMEYGGNATLLCIDAVFGTDYSKK